MRSQLVRTRSPRMPMVGWRMADATVPMRRSIPVAV